MGAAREYAKLARSFNLALTAVGPPLGAIAAGTSVSWRICSPKKITPLGNYAVGIEWNDGHASGIYPYTQLKEKSLSFKNA